MSKHFILSIIILFSLHAASHASEKIIYSKYTGQDTSIVEISNKWNDLDSVLLEGKDKGSDNSMVVKTQWDINNLYVLFDVKDTDLRAVQTEQDHPELYRDDMVEVLIDAHNDKKSCWSNDDIVYHINLLSARKDDRGTSDCVSDKTWNGRATFNVKLSGTLNDSTDIDSGYRVLIAIPWNEIGVIPTIGLKIGINFANSDNDGKSASLFDWVGSKLFRSPHLFGDLILSQ